MHYPPEEELGAKLLSGLFSLIGQEFHAMATSQKIKPNLISGLPNGATRLGEALASRYESEFPENWVRLNKKRLADGTTEFSQPQGLYLPGDELLPCEDHVSAARNNLLFLKHVRSLSFVVKN